MCNTLHVNQRDIRRKLTIVAVLPVCTHDVLIGLNIGKANKKNRCPILRSPLPHTELLKEFKHLGVDYNLPLPDHILLTSHAAVAF